MKKNIRQIIVFIILSFQVHSQSYVNSFINIYSKKVYQGHEQNWSITQDQKGYIYVANTNGLLKFDGKKWSSHTKIPNQSIISVKNSTGDSVFVGGIHEFGYVDQNFTYHSLSKTLKNIKIGMIRKILCTKNYVSFMSKENLFLWNGKKLCHIKAQSFFTTMANINDSLFLTDREDGLAIVRNNEIQYLKYKNDHLLRKSNIRNIIKWKEKLLFISYKNGIFYRENAEIKKFNIPFNFTDKKIFTATLRENALLLGSSYNGLFEIDLLTNQIMEYNSKNGLFNHQINTIFIDRNKNTWLGSNSGIAHIESNSGLKRLNYDKKLISSVNHFYRTTKNEIYIASKTGLFYSRDGNEFKPLIKNKVFWHIIKFKNKILASSSSGIYQISKTIIKQIQGTKNIRNIFKLILSTKNKNRVYCSTQNGLTILNDNNGHWKVDINPYNLNIQIRDVIENSDDIWLETLYSGVIRINEGKRTNYTKKNGLVTDNNNEIYLISGKVIISATNGLFEYSYKKDSIIETQLFGKKFNSQWDWVYSISKEYNNNVWLTAGNETDDEFTYLLGEKRKSHFILDTINFNRLSKNGIKIDKFFIDEEGLLWLLCRDDGIYLYEEKEPKHKFQAYISKLRLSNDSNINTKRSHIFDYDKNNIEFHFSSPFYIEHDKITYQYKLDNFDDQWSDWSKESKIRYTNLSENNYTFNLRAINVFDQISNIVNVSFKINPPWYRSYFAYMIYVACFFYILFIITRFRTKKLQREKEKLEKIVNERTIKISEQAEKLKEMDIIKSRFFANISHEFRTPLTMIISPLKDMISNTGSVKKEKLELMLRNSDNLLKLINQLLDLSKLEAGKMELNLEENDFFNFIKGTFHSFSSLASEKNIILELSSEVSVFIFPFDHDKMEKIFYNLLSNALKFSHKNSTVKLELKYLHKELIISIEDHGIGIDAKKLPYIFDRFYQAESSMTRNYQGTGIGMALVKEMVELHNGKISVVSQVNIGTKFTLKFPAEALKIEKFQKKIELDSPRPEEKESKEDTVKEDEVTILIVEDNNDVLQYINESFQNEYQTILARDGSEGLKKAEAFLPDIIISDLMMPELNGYELCKEIKTNLKTSHIPIILLTAKADIDSKIEGLETGADDYISKPFEKKELLARVKNLLKTREELRKKYQVNLFDFKKDYSKNLKELEKEFIEKARKIVLDEIDNIDFSVDDFCSKIAMSRTQLHRKLKSICNLSTTLFIRKVRLQEAAKILTKNPENLNISQIAYDVGFNNMSFFAKCFKEEYGVLPSEILSELKQS